MQVIKIIMTVISVCAAYNQDNHFNKKISVKENVFHNVGEDILNTAKNIFKVLNSKKNLTETPKITMLLTMHRGLSKIFERNYEIYDEIKNISKVTTDIKNNSRYFDLSGFTAMLYTVRLQKNKKKIKSIPNITQNQGKDNISGDFKDDKELTDFVNSFAAKLDMLTVNDLFKPANESGDNKMLEKQKFKYWSPEAHSEEQNPFNNITRRIYKGHAVKGNKHSFMASIHIDDTFVCSGSLISLNLIITAASCLNFEQVTSRSVVAHIGSDDLNQGGIFIPVVRVYTHPFFNPKNLRNNMAIIKLQKTSFDPTVIKRIKLHRDNTSIIPNGHTKVVVLGWGATDDNQLSKPNYQLRSAKLDVYDLQQCIDMYSSQYVTERHLCAGFFTKGGGACYKDVGGPGIINGVLVGVISFGPTVCGSPDAPTVFMKIGSYIAWISEIIYQVGQVESEKNYQKEEESDNTNKIPNMNTHYKERHSVHRNARDEAITIVKEIINEIVLTSDDHLDETLYNDLYEDFNQLYIKSLKQNFGELDDSIEIPKAITDEDSEYYNDHLNKTVIRSSDKARKNKDYYINTLASRSMENYASTDEADYEFSDNNEDEKGMNIDMSNTEYNINKTNQQETTDMWGLPKLLFLFNPQDKKNGEEQWNRNPETPSNDHEPPRYEHAALFRPTITTKLETNHFNTQSGRIGKSIYASDGETYNDYYDRYGRESRE